MSCAVMPEVFNIPHLLVNSGLPLTIEKRFEEDTIIFGGANEAGLF